MEAGTRLTPDELAALAPGDTVTIESGADFGRTRRSAGIVTRVTGTKICVIVQSARGVAYVQEFSLGTSWRTGQGGNLAALVSVEATEAVESQRREQQRIDALWRAWARNDMNALRELHAAIGERLIELQPTT